MERAACIGKKRESGRKTFSSKRSARRQFVAVSVFAFVGALL
jgi:hypothetical protein